MVIQCKNLISHYILPDQRRVNLLVFHIIANMGFWFLVMTGQALLISPKGCNRPGMILSNYGREAFII